MDGASVAHETNRRNPSTRRKKRSVCLYKRSASPDTFDPAVKLLDPNQAAAAAEAVQVLPLGTIITANTLLADIPSNLVPLVIAKTTTRQGYGGRQRQTDARLNPNLDPRKAARIQANRDSAARSKLKQKLLKEAQKVRSQVKKTAGSLQALAAVAGDMLTGEPRQPGLQQGQLPAAAAMAAAAATKDAMQAAHARVLPGLQLDAQLEGSKDQARGGAVDELLHTMSSHADEQQAEQQQFHEPGLEQQEPAHFVFCSHLSMGQHMHTTDTAAAAAGDDDGSYGAPSSQRGVAAVSVAGAAAGQAAVQQHNLRRSSSRKRRQPAGRAAVFAAAADEADDAAGPASPSAAAAAVAGLSRQLSSTQPAGHLALQQQPDGDVSGGASVPAPVSSSTSSSRLVADIQALVELLSSADEVAVMQAMRDLFSLLQQSLDCSGAAVAVAAAMQGLVALLLANSSSSDIQGPAIDVLRVMVECSQLYKAVIISSGAIPPLVALLDLDCSREVQLAACLALNSLASSWGDPATVDAIVAAGGVEGLLLLLSSARDGSQLRVAAASTLCDMAAANPLNKEAVTAAIGVAHILKPRGGI